MARRTVFRVVPVVATSCEYETDCISEEILRLLRNKKTNDFQPFRCDIINTPKLHITVCKSACNFANSGGRVV